MSVPDQHVPHLARAMPAALPQTHRVQLRNGWAEGWFRRGGRRTITPGGVRAADDDRELALSGYLGVLRERRGAGRPWVAGDGVDEAWVAVHRSGAVCGAASWSARQAGLDLGWCDRVGAARSLCRVAVHSGAPVSAVELLIVDALAEYRARGVPRLFLGRRLRAPWWGRAGDGHWARAWTTIEGCGPRWCPRWLALPAAWQLPAAALLRRGEES